MRDELLGEARRLRDLIRWMLEHQQRHQAAVVELDVDPRSDAKRKRPARFMFYVCTVGRSEQELCRAIVNGLAPIFRQAGFEVGESFMVGDEGPPR